MTVGISKRFFFEAFLRGQIQTSRFALSHLDAKNQKTSIDLGHGLVAAKALGPEDQKFLRRFFQKAAASSLRSFYARGRPASPA